MQVTVRTVTECEDECVIGTWMKEHATEKEMNVCRSCGVQNRNYEIVLLRFFHMLHSPRKFYARLDPRNTQMIKLLIETRRFGIR